MKSLFVICYLLVLYGSAVSVVKEYFYSSEPMPMSTGQGYCNENYGNLVSITSVEEHQEAVEVSGGALSYIGLKRTEPHVNSWVWINGDKINFTKWSNDEPNDGGEGENCVVMDQNGWRDTGCGGSFPPICVTRFTLVKENKTWEEALKHCRSLYTDLTFVDSTTLLELLIIETEETQTASVWTGLRFLDARWFWVNEMELGSMVSLPSRPVLPYRCGAYNFNTAVWENRDCNEKLNFLCYD